MPFSMNQIKANARKRVGKDVDLLLKNLKLKILGQPYDEVLITTDRRYKHFKAKENHIILKEGRLFRQNIGDTGKAKYYYFLIRKHLVIEVLRSLQVEFGKHPGITQTIMTYREK